MSLEEVGRLAGANNPMRAYAVGLRRAAMSVALAPQRHVFASGANCYSHGFFDAIEAVMALLVGHHEETPAAELWEMLCELRALATSPVDLRDAHDADPIRINSELRTHGGDSSSL